MTPARAWHVTVIIPVKGHPVLIDDAIASVERELEAGVIRRLIVVEDGCAHDETRRALASWQALLGVSMMVLHTENGGLSRARNRGIAAALELDPDLDAIFLLDADNMLAEGAGARMGHLLSGWKEADWFYPEFDFFGQNGQYITEAKFDLLLAAEANPCDAGSLIRRRVLDAGVRFDEEMRQGYEDWDFWLQAARLCFQGRSARQPLLHYRKRPVSMLSRSHAQDDELRRYLHRKHDWLYRLPKLVALEAERFPRFALIEGETRKVTLCVDPLEPKGSDWRALERMIMAHLADPYANHAPAYLVFLREGVAEHLTSMRLIHAMLWTCERRVERSGHDMELFFLDHSDDGSLSLVTDGGNPERPADAICLSISALERMVRDPDEDWLRQLDSLPLPCETESWSIRCPHWLPESGGSTSAAEIMRAALLSLARSPWRGALTQEWNWRAPGGAIRRERVVQIPRGAVEGGIAMPLLKHDDVRDIGIVLPIFSFGGVEKVAANIARELRAEGYRLHLFVISDRPVHAEPWALEPFSTVNWLPDADALDWSGEEYLGTAEPAWGEGMQAPDLMGLLASMDAVINAHSAALHKVADGLRRRGVLMIDHEHLVERSTYGRGYGPPHLALAYEQAYDLFLTCSETLRLWMHGNGIPAEKLIAVPNAPGYPMSPAEQRCITGFRGNPHGRRAPLRVLFLGRFDRQKGIRRLCTIYNVLAERLPQIDLTIAGRAVVEDQGQQLSWPPQVRFLGPVLGPEALTRLLTQTDILVLPSYFEGLPLSVLEAQRCGVVVLAAEAGALHEAIDEGRTGFIVPQDECERHIIDRILALDRDRDLLAEISARTAGHSRTWRDATATLRGWLQERLPLSPPVAARQPRSLHLT